MKKIYLDVCTFCRPFDNQYNMRIRLETDAYFLILNEIQKQNYELIISKMHYKEVESIDDLSEKVQLINLFEDYGKKFEFSNNKTKTRANELISINFGIADAVHLAFAEQSADFLITCDDKFLKKCKKISTNIKIMNPVEFCINEELK